MDTRSQINSTLWVHEVVGGSVTNILFKSHSYSLIHSVGHSSSNALVKTLALIGYVTQDKTKLSIQWKSKGSVFLDPFDFKRINNNISFKYLSIYIYIYKYYFFHRIWFYQVRDVPVSTSLLTLEQHCDNQSDLKNQFIVFVKFRLTISVWCLYIHVSFIYHFLRL